MKFIYFKGFQAGLFFLLLSNFFVIASETDTKQIITERSGYWTYYCKNYEQQRQCEIARKVKIEEQNETFLIVYKIIKNINSKVTENLNILTPPAERINTKKRLKISFDDKTKFTRSFLKCEDTDCLAVFKSNRILKYSMENFNKMKITFYISGDNESTSLTLPMDGFSKALKDIKEQLKLF